MPKTIFMSISFIIPAKNEESQIGKTIEHILRQPPELVKEIIVVDNGSTDNTAGVAASYPSVKVLSEPIPGTNQARQKGLDAATGEIVAFIDADTWIADDWSENAIKLMAKPGVVGASGPYTNREEGALRKFFTYYLFFLIAYPAYLFIHYVLRRGGIVIGGNLAAKRDALLKVGGLDTSFKFFGDDANTGRRLRKAGRVLFTTKLKVQSSNRRFQKHGYFKTSFRYFMNYLWVILFNRPFTR